jgi:pilus assembly protein CpaF
MDAQKILAALGPLAAPFQDEEIQEIMVDSPGQVYGVIKGQMTDLKVEFDSLEALRTMIDDVLALAGTDVNEKNTTADIRLPDDSRFRVVVPPTAVNGPYVVILKPFIRRMTWEDLLSFGSVDEAATEVFDRALAARKNILISGGTASGKTTLLNLVAGRIPQDERIVAVEDIHYLRIPHQRVIYLEANAAQSSMDELIEMGGRMYPGWLIVNELNGPESLKALELFNAGYTGMGSTHAESPEDALARLESYCLMSNQGLALTDIRRLIAGGFGLVVQLDKLHGSNKRRVIEMSEMQGVESGRYLLQPLVRYDPDGDWFDRIAEPGW